MRTMESKYDDTDLIMGRDWSYTHARYSILKTYFGLIEIVPRARNNGIKSFLPFRDHFLKRTVDTNLSPMSNLHNFEFQFVYLKGEQSWCVVQYLRRVIQKTVHVTKKNILFIRNLLLVVQAIIINSVDQLFGSVMLKPEAKAQRALTWAICRPNIPPFLFGFSHLGLVWLF